MTEDRLYCPPADDAPWLRRLIVSALSNLHRVSIGGEPHSHPRWYVASEVFGLGSTSAINLCRDFGLDPHEEIGGFEKEDG